MVSGQSKRASILFFGAVFLFCWSLASTLPVFASGPAAKKGDTVQIHYTGKLQDNSVFDKSEGRPPLQFTLGSGQVIPGMDKAVTGMKVGESKTVSIPPEEAYGNYSEKMIFEVPTDKLPPGVKAGEKLMNPHGQRVTVKDIQGKTAHLDGNHFLAGKTLIFDIELMSINPPAGK